jgi:hypothetical protein
MNEQPCEFHIGPAKDMCKRCGASLAAHYGLPDLPPQESKRRRLAPVGDSSTWSHAHDGNE